MLHMLGIALIAGVATIVTTGGAMAFRTWRRAVHVARRNEEFGQRFKRSGFAERSGWEHAHTHPAPLDSVS